MSKIQQLQARKERLEDELRHVEKQVCISPSANVKEFATHRLRMGSKYATTRGPTECSSSDFT
eukprot:5776926-Pyramimonas_sp.AAC.1